VQALGEGGVGTGVRGRAGGAVLGAGGDEVGLILHLLAHQRFLLADGVQRLHGVAPVAANPGLHHLAGAADLVGQARRAGRLPSGLELRARVEQRLALVLGVLGLLTLEVVDDLPAAALGGSQR
jgi:hypothetical protein